MLRVRIWLRVEGRNPYAMLRRGPPNAPEYDVSSSVDAVRKRRLTTQSHPD